MPERVLSVSNRFFPRLFEPGLIGGTRVKNRIVMSPMGTQFASDTGAVTDRLVRHYVRRARGGVGLIIVEFTCVDYPRGKGHASQLALHDDRLIAGHADLVEAVHLAGAKIAIQLQHSGANTFTCWTEYFGLVAPAFIPSRSPQDQPCVLSVKEIAAIVRKFGAAASRAKTAGYDCIELHGAHGYLISEFMSPYINTRTDGYGGTLEKRMRFPLEVIACVREAVGAEFPVSMRISGQELVPGGRSLEETKVLARQLEAAGLDALHVSAGVDTDCDWAVDPIYAEQARKAHLAAGIKAVTGIPVVAVGVIREPQVAEAVLQKSQADFIALGRALLADPDWPHKAAEGRTDEIRKCFSCNYCDGVRNRAGLGVRCVVNVELGRGDEAHQTERCPVGKRVMVVGGGPAGMEAARVAALRGHDVTLFDRNLDLGGQLLLAAKVPHKGKINWLLEGLRTDLDESGVTISPGVDVAPDLIAAFAPEVLVFATGAEPLLPQIPGCDSCTCLAWSVIDGTAVLDARRVAVIGGNATGCEVALKIADASPEVTVVVIEQLAHLARDMEPFARATTVRQIEEAPNIEVLLHSRVLGISATEVQVVHEAGDVRFVDVDAVVLATGVVPDRKLLSSLTEFPCEVYTVGDCHEVRNIAAAVLDGRTVGGLL